VNSERVLREASPAKAAQAKLEAEFGKRDRELNDFRPQAQGRRRQARQGRADAGRGRAHRRQRELVEQDRDLQRKRREFQEDLNQRKNEELASRRRARQRVIKQIFDAEKYDLILQEVVFAGPRVDITDKVIKA
jgi:outer membrane protein